MTDTDYPRPALPCKAHGVTNCPDPVHVLPLGPKPGAKVEDVVALADAMDKRYSKQAARQVKVINRLQKEIQVLTDERDALLLMVAKHDTECGPLEH